MAGLIGEAEKDQEDGLGDGGGLHRWLTDMSHGDILEELETGVNRKSKSYQVPIRTTAWVEILRPSWG